MKKIRFVVTRDGKIQMDFDGFRGQTCIREFEKIAEGLRSAGINVEGISRQLKPEFYEQEEGVEQ